MENDEEEEVLSPLEKLLNDVGEMMGDRSIIQLTRNDGQWGAVINTNYGPHIHHLGRYVPTPVEALKGALFEWERTGRDLQRKYDEAMLQPQWPAETPATLDQFEAAREAALMTKIKNVIAPGCDACKGEGCSICEAETIEEAESTRSREMAELEAAGQMNIEDLLGAETPPADDPLGDMFG